MEMAGLAAGKDRAVRSAASAFSVQRVATEAGLRHVALNVQLTATCAPRVLRPHWAREGAPTSEINVGAPCACYRVWGLPSFLSLCMAISGWRMIPLGGNTRIG